MDGIERIKVLASEVTNKPVLKIVDHLVSREDMNEKYLNEEKSLKQMISFIKSKAQKQEEDGCAMLEDEEVYSLAIHYWDESNEALGIKSEEELKKEREELRRHNEEIFAKQKAARKKQEETTKEDAKKVVERIEPKESKPKWVPEGQLTLF